MQPVERTSFAYRFVGTLVAIGYYWLWSLSSWLVLGSLEHALRPRGEWPALFLLWIIGPLYSIVVLFGFSAALLQEGLSSISPGSAFWRLSLATPGLMILGCGAASLLRDGRRIEGWLFAGITAALAVLARVIGGLATQGGYL